MDRGSAHPYPLSKVADAAACAGSAKSCRTLVSGTFAMASPDGGLRFPWSPPKGGRTHEGTFLLNSNAPSTRRRRRPERSAAAERTPRPRAAVTDIDDAPQETVRTDATWADLGVPANLISALEAQGLDTPFPIQAATPPDTPQAKDA